MHRIETRPMRRVWRAPREPLQILGYLSTRRVAAHPGCTPSASSYLRPIGTTDDLPTARVPMDKTRQRPRRYKDPGSADVGPR